MSKKAVTINFSLLDSAIDTFNDDLDIKLSQLAESDARHGLFIGKNREYFFKVLDPVVTNRYKLHFVCIAKEREYLPVLYNREGELKEPPVVDSIYGDITYAVINTDNGIIATLNCGLGPSASVVGEMASFLIGHYGGIAPAFTRDVYSSIMQWEIFRKLTIAAEAFSSDYIDEIISSSYGEYLKLVQYLAGLKIEVTVSMGHSKGFLHKDAVKQLIRSVVDDKISGNKIAGKLKISGKSFGEQKTEEIDIYNARVKHKTEIVVHGWQIAPDEAIAALFEAYQLKSDEIYMGDNDEQE